MKPLTIFYRKVILISIITTTCHAFLLSNLFSKVESVTLYRSAALSGFHRILKYNVTLNEVDGESHILIEEKLPKDIYVDPYQVLKLIDENKLKIISDHEINTEWPAYEAEPFSVLLCSYSKTNYHELELPIHLRYQKPHECDISGETVTVILGSPSLYIRSSSKNSTNALEKDLTCHPEIEENTSWVQIRTAKLKTSFEVPVGCTEHLYLVLFSTAVVIGFATLYVCYVLVS